MKYNFYGTYEEVKKQLDTVLPPEISHLFHDTGSGFFVSFMQHAFDLIQNAHCNSEQGDYAESKLTVEIGNYKEIYKMCIKRQFRYVLDLFYDTETKDIHGMLSVLYL